VTVGSFRLGDAAPARGPGRTVAAPSPHRGRRRSGAAAGAVGADATEARIRSGCTSEPSSPAALSGSPAGDRVALSFDDGPSVTQTPPNLHTLEHLHAHATFFEEGRHVHRREELMREILAAGDEIGNHSYHHPEYPGNGELVYEHAYVGDFGATPDGRKQYADAFFRNLDRDRVNRQAAAGDRRADHDAVGISAGAREAAEGVASAMQRRIH
jgi:hypothetical protein